MASGFTDHRTAALALLNASADLREKEGQFLGGLSFRTAPLTEKQANWLRILLEKHGLAPLIDGGKDHD